MTIPIFFGSPFHSYLAMCPCFTYITTTNHKVTFMRRNVPDLKVHVDHQTVVGTCGQKGERKNKVATVTLGGNVCM